MKPKPKTEDEWQDQVLDEIERVGSMYKETTSDYEQRFRALEDTQARLVDQTARQRLRASSAATLGNPGQDDDQIVVLGHDVKSGEPVKGYRKGARLAPHSPEATERLGSVVRSMLLGEPVSKAASGAIPTAGGVLLEAPLASEILDVARSTAQVVAAGGITVPMRDRTLTVARITSTPPAVWRPENVAVTPADAVWSAVKLEARTLCVIVRASLELFEDAANLGQALSTSLGEALGNEIDRVALVGTGSASEPLGIENSGCQTITSVGSPVYDDFTDACVKVQTANGTPLAVIAHPRDLGTLAKLRAAAPDGQYLLAPEPWRLLLKLPTTQAPSTRGGGSNESLAFVGDFDNVWIGIKGDAVRLDVSRDAGAPDGTSAFTSLQVFLRAWVRCDIAVLRPSHLVTLSGITA